MRTYIMLTLLLISIVCLGQKDGFSTRNSDIEPWAISAQYHSVLVTDCSDYVILSQVPLEREPFWGFGFILMGHYRFRNWGLASGLSYKEVGVQFEFDVSDSQGQSAGKAKNQDVYRYIGLPIQLEYLIKIKRHRIAPFLGYEYVYGTDKFNFVDTDVKLFPRGNEKMNIDENWRNVSYLFVGAQYAYNISPNWAVSAGFRMEWGLDQVLQENRTYDAKLMSGGFTLGVIRDI